MKKKVKKGICLVGIMALALFGGVMTSYAVGPGEVNQTVAKPIIYNQQYVKALGNWEQQGSIWKFRCLDGTYLSNAWLESLTETGAFYYVDSNGSMMVNAATPDGYEVDANGLWRSGVEVQESEAGNSEDRKSDSRYYGIPEEYLNRLDQLELGVGSYDNLH